MLFHFHRGEAPREFDLVLASDLFACSFGFDMALGLAPFDGALPTALCAGEGLFLTTGLAEVFRREADPFEPAVTSAR